MVCAHGIVLWSLRIERAGWNLGVTSLVLYSTEWLEKRRLVEARRTKTIYPHGTA